MADNYDSAVFEQAVAAARFSARALMTVCAAVIILAASDQENPYQQALYELDKLSAPDYLELVREFAARNDAHVNRQVSILRNILGNVGLELSLASNDVITFKTDNSFTLHSDSTPLRLIDRDTTMPNNAVWGEVKNIQSVEDGLRRLVAEIRPEIPTYVKTVRIGFDNSQPTETIAHVGWGGGRTKAEDIRGPVGSIEGSIEYYVPLDCLDMLSQNDATADLVVRANNERIFLPKTKDARVWFQVRNMTIPDAMEYLAALANAPNESLEVIGLSIPNKYVSWGAPLILVLFCFNLLTHIRYLAANAPSEIAGFYGWTPLMPGFLASCHTVATLIVLPTTALAMLFLYSIQTADPSHFLSIGLLIASAAFLLLALWFLRQLRRRRATC